MKKMLFPFFAVSYFLAHMTLHLTLHPIHWVAGLFN
ncbi:hypothetical protein IGI50_003338 [Enterococcus sp. DIV0170]|jgi:hypothetical protein